MEATMDLTQFTYEELANALYRKGKAAGFHKITDKTKWREPVMADKLGHQAFTKISAGKDSDKYGADAEITGTGKKAEYKSKALEDKDLRNLLQLPKGKKGKTFSPLTVGGVYNGAYSHEAVDRYAEHEHYFGLFYEELCVLVIRVKNSEVDRQLRTEIDRRAKLAKQGSTNLNTVSICLDQTDLYDVAYRNDQWFKDKTQELLQKKSK
jgi:hypothetical protein